MYVWGDEAWFASPALNLVQKGVMGTTILESKGSWMEGLDRYTYWVLPLHILFQALWYKLFGFSLLVLRSLSIFWGAVTVLAWYLIAVRVSGDRKVGLLAAGLIARDSHFIQVSALGRMDMLCAGLGSASLAVFWLLRERGLDRAILASHTLAAASCLTHPAGVLYFGALVLITLYEDRTRIWLRETALAATPYLIALGAWGLYVLQSPALFWSQFTGNISGITSEFTEFDRLSGLRHPLAALFRERIRYLAAFKWYVARDTLDRCQISILLVYTLGVAAALCSRSIRRHPGYRLLMLIGSLYFLVLAEFEGQKLGPYLVHTLPLCATLTAAVSVHFWSAGGVARRVTVLILTALICLQIGYNLRDDNVTRDQLDALDFLKRHATPASQIVGGAELAFDLGFDSILIDDPKLGFYSRKRPDFIAANRVYYAGGPGRRRDTRRFMHTSSGC